MTRARSAAAPERAARVGESSLARAFFAGRYEHIVARTFDRGAAFPATDLAFVVGALTFVGRVEDAQLAFEGRRLGRARASTDDARTVGAAHFFLGVAYARAGDFERAHRFLVADARRRARADDPWITAFVHQGLACHRYFTGRYRASARHALRALRAAHVAGFAYVQMLAHDLRGHALAQVGQYRAAVVLLDRARASAEALGFENNAYAIECSIANYVAESAAGPEGLERIAALLGRSSHDSYSKRSLLAGLAAQLALRGRGTEARAALAEADVDAVAKGTRRAKLTNLVARLQVVRWCDGPAACGEILEQAADLVDRSDVALRAELLAFEAYVGAKLADEGRRARAVSALKDLAGTTELHRATAALEQLAEIPLRLRAFPEDELTPLMRAVATHDRASLARFLSLGLLGPVPELLGLPSGRRIVLLGAENALLVTDRGDVRVTPNPPRWSVALLRLLARGIATKQAIMSALWGLRVYHPDRHDPLIRTTIHRLRALLGPSGLWIFVALDGGYGSSAPIDFLGGEAETDLAELATPLVEGQAPDVDAVAAPRPAALVETTDTTEQRVLAKLLESGGRLGSNELSRALGVSESTVLRALRVLVRRKRAARRGFARATRYEALR